MMFQSRQHNIQKELHDLRLERKNLLFNSGDFFIREAYKTLRTNIIFSLTDETASKVILVTSAYQSEGKSFTAANIAISFAQADKKVLLVDCDLRRPKIGRLLGLHSEIGLSNVLINPSLYSSAVVSTSEKNLKVLQGGRIPPNPSELLGSRRMQDFLQMVRSQFDYIILDTSPVNMVTDAAVLASFSDGVLFVVRSGKSDKNNIMRALDQLRYANAKVLGFVFNGSGHTGGQYGKYSRRRYQYDKYGSYELSGSGAEKDS